MKEQNTEHQLGLSLKFENVFAMPNKNTFEIKPIRKLIDEEKVGKPWIDPFARDSKLAEITNDINKLTKADYHLEALEFFNMFRNGEVKGVLFDPAYSPRQLAEVYQNEGIAWDGTNSFWSQWEAEAARVIEPGGKVIKLGWNSHLIGKGFEITRILLVNHGSHHNDTIVTVQRKMNEVLA